MHVVLSPQIVNLQKKSRHQSDDRSCIHAMRAAVAIPGSWSDVDMVENFAIVAGRL